MAAKFPGYRPRTSSGRRITPSGKVRQALKESAENIMWTQVNNIEALTTRLTEHLSQSPPDDHFMNTIQEWMMGYVDVQEAESEWRKHADDDDQLRCEHKLSMFHSSCEEFLNIAASYVSPGNPKSDDTAPDETLVKTGSPGTRGRSPSTSFSFMSGEDEYMDQPLNAKDQLSMECDGNSVPKDKDSVHSPGKQDFLTRYEHLEAELRTLEQEISVRNSPSKMDQTSRSCKSVRIQVPGASSCYTVSPNDNAFSCPAPASDPTQALNRLADILLQNQRSDKLPRMEPSVFDGSYLDFPMWWNSFVTLVESKVTNPIQRLHFLSKYTKGAAKESIQGYLRLVNDPKAYERARSRILTRFGNRLRIADTFRRKLSDWPVIQEGDYVSLQKYCDFLWQCESAMDTIGYLSVLNEQDENVKLASKLPSDALKRWNRLVVKKLYNFDSPTVEDVCDDAQYPDFLEFCNFVQQEAWVAGGPCMQQRSIVKTPKIGSSPKSERLDVKSDNDKRKASHNLSMHLNIQKVKQPEVTRDTVQEGTKSKVHKCGFCQDVSHDLPACSSFQKLTVEERQGFARANKFCFTCLKSAHSFRRCRAKAVSQGKVPLLPYEGRSGETGNSVPNVPVSTDSGNAVTSHVAGVSDQSEVSPITLSDTYIKSMCTSGNKPLKTYYSMVVQALLFHTERPTYKYKVYVLLDTQSEGTFVTEQALEILNVDGPRVDLSLLTMGNKCSVSSMRISGLRLQSLVRPGEIIHIDNAYSREIIPCTRSSIPDPESVAQWPHLTEVSEWIPPVIPEMSVCLLLGYDCFHAFRPINIVTGYSAEPFAIETPLGWTVMGPSIPDVQSYTTHTLSIAEQNLQVVQKAFDSEFVGDVRSDTKMSYDDKCFLDLMLKFRRLDEDGHVELPLPIRPGIPEIPSSLSRKTALRRFYSLQRKLDKDEIFKQRYFSFIQNMLDDLHCEQVPPMETDTHKPYWYLPHQGVYHPRKPDKLRVVFDGSMECAGIALNSILMTGPDLCNNLSGVLLRFREESIAFCCDIRGMFHQVRVRKQDRDYLRFFWFKDNIPGNPIQEFRVTVHLFGASSSPTCATYALRYVADMFEYGHDAAQFVRRDFYVDDGLRSVATPEDALSLITRSRNLCASGGFDLLKFYSNSKEVMANLPTDIRSSESADWDPLSGDRLPNHVTLGLGLNLELDVFYFRFQLDRVCATRRDMLSFISSIYDPLGFLSPITLRGRQFLQSLCRERFSWDERIPEGPMEEWRLWQMSLAAVHSIQIPRCYRLGLETVSAVELHIFSDASSTGYGCCAYLVLRDFPLSAVVSRLLYAKARVMPLRSVTIPRMELQSAVVASQVKRFLLDELPYDSITTYMWTDSQIVLAYLQNPQKRFFVYVANRIQTILDRTEVCEWRYVPSELNPADHASRGVLASTLLDCGLWWRGPSFIRDGNFPEQPTVQVNESDPEIRISTACVQIVKPEFIAAFADCSSWDKLVKHFMIYKRLVICLKAKVAKKSYSYTGWSVIEKQDAINTIVRLTQMLCFPNAYYTLANLCPSLPSDMELLKRKKSRSIEAEIRKLDPFMDQSKVICVGGRIKHASLPLGIKHPIIMPKCHFISILIIRNFHVRTNHSGRYLTMSSVRMNGWWMVGIRACVTYVISRCVVCKKLRGKLITQKMANLPADRLECTPPFTYVGVDFFGPFFVQDARNKRVQHKRYVCIFTCLVVRAIHLEICYNLTSDSFICAYRRFVDRRGPVRMLRCDRGTNLLGARADLEQALADFNHGKIRARTLQDNCDWVEYAPNPPKASHMGGVWERMIRSVRNVFNALLSANSNRLDDESLVTFMTEAEACVNSRPLAYTDIENSFEIQPLSPSTILTLKPRTLMPPSGEFVKEDMCLKERWRQVQYLSNLFWKRWVSEYVPLLQERQKWLYPQNNLQVDDLVLIAEENKPRNHWPLARVVAVKTSEDGLVRSLTLRTAAGEYTRPIHKLVFIYRPQVPS